MSESNTNPSARQRFALALAGVLLAASGVVAYFGVRDSWSVAPRPDEITPTAAALIDEVEIPPGPHRGEFQASCVTCHSPRLALNQPALSREKWVETVHKMAAAYGAPLTSDDEARVVEYLTAVQATR